MKRDNAKKLLDAIGTAALVGFAGGVAKALAGLLLLGTLLEELAT